MFLSRSTTIFLVPIRMGAPQKELEDGEKFPNVFIDEAEAYERGHDPIRANKMGLGKVSSKLFTWGIETRGESLSNVLSNQHLS